MRLFMGDLAKLERRPNGWPWAAQDPVSGPERGADRHGERDQRHDPWRADQECGGEDDG